MNLDPLQKFLLQQLPEGNSLAIHALELGMSRQGVSTLFNSDNAHLSKAKDIAKNMDTSSNITGSRVTVTWYFRKIDRNE